MLISICTLRLSIASINWLALLIGVTIGSKSFSSCENFATRHRLDVARWMSGAPRRVHSDSVRCAGMASMGENHHVTSSADWVAVCYPLRPLKLKILSDKLIKNFKRTHSQYFGHNFLGITFTDVRGTVSQCAVSRATRNCVAYMPNWGPFWS